MDESWIVCLLIFLRDVSVYVLESLCEMNDVFLSFTRDGVCVSLIVGDINRRKLASRMGERASSLDAFEQDEEEDGDARENGNDEERKWEIDALGHHADEPRSEVIAQCGTDINESEAETHCALGVRGENLP